MSLINNLQYCILIILREKKRTPKGSGSHWPTVTNINCLEDEKGYMTVLFHISRKFLLQSS